MREIWARLAQTTGAQMYLLLVSLAMLILTARWLGPEGRGTIAAITAWSTLFGGLGHLSLGQVAIHRATVLRGRPWLASTLGSLLLLDGITAAVGWMVAAGLLVFTDAFRGFPLLALGVGFLALPLNLWDQHGGGLLAALDRVTVYNAAQMLGRSSGGLLAVAAWYLDWGVTGVLAAILVAQMLAALFGIRFLWRHAERRPRPELQTMRELLKGGSRLHLNYVAGYLVSCSGILIISHQLGAIPAGHYNVAAQVMHILVIIPQAASLLLFGKVVQLGPDAAWQLQRTLLAHLLLGMVVLAALAAVVAPWVLPRLLGADFDESVRPFRILLLTTIGATLGWVMFSQWIARGMFLHLATITGVSGALALIGNFLLIPRFGIEGAAWVSVAVHGIAALSQGWMILHCEGSMRRSLVSGALGSPER